VFWTEYELRKAALIRELVKPQRLSPVATRFLARIRTSTNVPAIGRWLYRTQRANDPGGPRPEEWTVLWAIYQQAKAGHPAPTLPLLQRGHAFRTSEGPILPSQPAASPRQRSP